MCANLCDGGRGVHANVCERKNERRKIISGIGFKSWSGKKCGAKLTPSDNDYIVYFLCD